MSVYPRFPKLRNCSTASLSDPAMRASLGTPRSIGATRAAAPLVPLTTTPQRRCRAARRLCFNRRPSRHRRYPFILAQGIREIYADGGFGFFRIVETGQRRFSSRLPARKREIHVIRNCKYAAVAVRPLVATIMDERHYEAEKPNGST